MTTRFEPSQLPPRHHRSDAIVLVIKQWIMSKGLKPGDRLPIERDLIELFDSSRGTVREALKILESQGLVEIVAGPKGGARIASVTRQRTSQFFRNFLCFKPVSWAQVYAVREKIEPMLAASVVDHLTGSDLARLKNTIEICRDGIVGQVAPREHRAAELEFHSILCDASPDPMLELLAGFINDLLLDFTSYRNVIEPLESDFATTALDYHTALLDAFERRDKERVVCLMEQHMHHSGCIVCKNEVEFDGGYFLTSANGFGAGLLRRH